MNFAEGLVLGLAALLLGYYLHRQFRSWPAVVGLLAVCALPLYLSLERTSQFLTADENGIFAQMLGPDRAGFLDYYWKAGAFRTTLTALSPALRLAPASEGTILKLAGVLKLIHWLTGLLTFVWIIHLARRLRPAMDYRLFFPLLLSVLLLLPTSEMALKTFNYDLLSMTLGAAAALYLVLALREGSPGLALTAVVVAYLGAQEKLIASPLVLLAVIIFVWLRQTKHPHACWWRMAPDLARAFLLLMALGVACMAVAWLLAGLAVPSPGLLGLRAAGPFISWAWAVLLFLAGTGDFDRYFLWLVLASVLLCWLGAFVLLRLAPWAARWRMPDLLPPCTGGLLVVVFVVGLLGNWWVQAYWAPFQPVSAGHYRPPGELNGVTLHFNAVTLGGHLLSFVGYAYAVFVNALPTAVWLLAAVWVIVSCRRRSEAQTPLLSLLLGGCLLAPLGYALLQVCVGHRYLNLFLTLAAVCLAVGGTTLLGRLPRWPAWGAVVVLLGLLVAETLPFRPFYAPFRPWWIEYSDPHAPVAGKINPSWVGWGEEMMLAGQRLRTSRTDLNLYCCYWSGVWLTRDRSVHQKMLLGITQEKDVGYGETDYFILNRSMVAQGFPLPAGVAPQMVLSFRGFDQAWVYQGSRLRAAGYHYDPSRHHFVRSRPAG